MPKISIITASYNYQDYISDTIQSVINQTFQDWEMIIVDDGSCDNSIEVIKSFCEKDNRIKLFVHDNNENKGLKETLLLGISKIEGEWVAFLESDDLWREDYLEKKIGIIEKFPEVGIIFNDVELFGDEKKVSHLTKIFDKNNKKLMEKNFPRNIFKEINISNRILTFSVFMAKKSILQKEYFNTPVDKLLDWWLYIHLTFENEVYYIPEKLTKWRMHRDSYMSKLNINFRFVNVEAYFDIYKKTGGIDFLLFILKTCVISFVLKLKRIRFYIVCIIKRYLIR